MELTPFKSNLFPQWGRTSDRDFNALQREMSDVLDSFLGRQSFNAPQVYDMSFYPAIDVKEKNEKYILEAELPGIDENAVELDFHNNVLTIQGERKSEVEKKEEGFSRTERYLGSFRRDIPFECEVNPDNIQAELKNGILCVELMKKEKGSMSHKKIKIVH